MNKEDSEPLQAYELITSFMKRCQENKVALDKLSYFHLMDTVFKLMPEHFINAGEQQNNRIQALDKHILIASKYCEKYLKENPEDVKMHFSRVQLVLKRTSLNQLSLVAIKKFAQEKLRQSLPVLRTMIDDGDEFQAQLANIITIAEKLLEQLNAIERMQQAPKGDGPELFNANPRRQDQLPPQSAQAAANDGLRQRRFGNRQ